MLLNANDCPGITIVFLTNFKMLVRALVINIFLNRDITSEFLVKSKLRDLNALCRVRKFSFVIYMV